jgi:hypothetical protein
MDAEPEQSSAWKSRSRATAAPDSGAEPSTLIRGWSAISNASQTRALTSILPPLAVRFVTRARPGLVVHRVQI